MYPTPYHTEDLSKIAFLVTGGAGFIGSNLVEYLLKYGAGKVRVLDNLSNGFYHNIQPFILNKSFEFIEGDIRDPETCRKACEGMDYVSHQAALGSVPRSINDPLTTNDVNISGFLNILMAVKDARNVRRMVYAASSSTYGDSQELPKVEGREGKPLSPYGVTKAVNEQYADVFSKIYNLHTIGLRYFNIFGPKQSPDNAYAAVIPIFCEAFINGRKLIINGDGHTSRDFTFVENAVQANIKAMLSEDFPQHEVFNVACGDQVSLNEIIELLQHISGKIISPVYGSERPGDVKHSKASIKKIETELNYCPQIRFKEGLELAYKYYLEQRIIKHNNDSKNDRY